MTTYIILSRLDIIALMENKPIVAYIDNQYIDNKRCVLCTEEYYAKHDVAVFDKMKDLKV